jgi:aspartyl protease family protein
MSLTWAEAVIRILTRIGTQLPKRLLIQPPPQPFTRRIAEELQLPIIGRRRVMTAKGTTELDECVGVVEVMGRKAYTHMPASNDLGIVLVSATTLELGLEVDPAAGKLKEAATYLL